MTDVYQCGKVHFLFVSSCLQNNLLFALDFFQLPGWNRLELFPLLIHCGFCIRNFHVHQVVMCHSILCLRCLFVLERIRTSAMRVIHVSAMTQVSKKTARQVCTVLLYLNLNLENQINKQALSASKPPGTLCPVAPSTAIPTFSASFDAITSQPSEPPHHRRICLHERGRIIDAINSHSSEPATTLQHLNDLETCFTIPITRHVSFANATRCVQVHFDIEFTPPSSSEDDVFDNVAATLRRINPQRYRRLPS